MISSSTVLKAELKSKRTNIVTCCRFMLCKISSTTLESADSVLCCHLYADAILDASYGLPSVYVMFQT